MENDYKLKVYPVRLSPGDIQRLDDLSTEQGRKMGTLAREALLIGLGVLEQGPESQLDIQAVAARVLEQLGAELDERVRLAVEEKVGGAHLAPSKQATIPSRPKTPRRKRKK